MQYVRHCIAAAKTLGAVNIVGPLYASVGRTWHATPDERARDTDLLVRQHTELARVAGDHGVVLCIEPLNRFETSVINLASQAIDVVDRVDHPACRVMLDTFHMNIEERSIGDAIRAAGKRLHHMHLCENDRGAPGSGHVPWQEVAQARVARLGSRDRSSSSRSPARSSRSRARPPSGVRWLIRRTSSPNRACASYDRC